MIRINKNKILIIEKVNAKSVIKYWDILDGCDLRLILNNNKIKDELARFLNGRGETLELTMLLMEHNYI